MAATTLRSKMQRGQAAAGTAGDNSGKLEQTKTANTLCRQRELHPA